MLQGGEEQENGSGTAGSPVEEKSAVSSPTTENEEATAAAVAAAAATTLTNREFRSVCTYSRKHTCIPTNIHTHTYYTRSKVVCTDAYM